MPKQNYFEKGQLTDTAYLVLLTLVEPKHGYSIMSEIDEMTEGREVIGAASLYTTLRKLMETGYIELVESEANKKTYLITEAGLATLFVEIKKRERLAEYGVSACKRIGRKLS